MKLKLKMFIKIFGMTKRNVTLLYMIETHHIMALQIIKDDAGGMPVA